MKLSDELHLNEIDSVRLLVSSNQEWGLMGRDPLEIQRLATGLWYTGRRDLTSTLYTLLRVAYSLIIFLTFFLLLVFLTSSHITIFLVG